MIKLIDTLDDYTSSLQILDNYSELAVDIETYIIPKYKGRFQKALNPHHSDISTIQLKARDSDVFIFDVLTLGKQNVNFDKLKELLETRTVLIGHNLSFEAKFFKKFWGVYFDNLYCTRVAAQLIANAFGAKFIRSASDFSLKQVCKDYLSIELEGKGTLQAEDWLIRPLSPAKLNYAANDVLHLFQLKELFDKVLLSPLPDIYDDDPDNWGLDMKEILEMEMQFVNVEAECEYNGLPVNSHLINLFEESLGGKDKDQGELLKVAGELCKEINLPTRQSLNPEINYVIPSKDSLKTLNSSQKLTPIINTFIGSAKTAEGKVVRRMFDLLEQIKDTGDAEFCSEEEEVAYAQFKELAESELIQKHKIASLLLKYKLYFKQSSMKVSKYVHDLTGRIHYSLNSLGASTGRASSSSPNSQNINAKVEVEITIPKEQINKYFTGTSKIV